MVKTAKYKYSGEKIDFTNSSGTAIAVGDVIPLVNRIGIALESIDDGDVDTVAVSECFELPAINTVAFAVGDRVFWDVTAQKLTNVGLGNTPAGEVTEIKEQAGTTAVINICCGGFDRQANITDISTTNGSDATTTQALANANKAKINEILATLRSSGVIG